MKYEIKHKYYKELILLWLVVIIVFILFQSYCPYRSLAALTLLPLVLITYLVIHDTIARWVNK